MKTLADWGITYDQSSQWQRLASVPKAKFEEAIAQISAITQFDGPVFRAFEGHAFGTDGADRLTSQFPFPGV